MQILPKSSLSVVLIRKYHDRPLNENKLFVYLC